MLKIEWIDFERSNSKNPRRERKKRKRERESKKLAFHPTEKTEENLVILSLIERSRLSNGDSADLPKITVSGISDTASCTIARIVIEIAKDPSSMLTRIVCKYRRRPSFADGIAIAIGRIAELFSKCRDIVPIRSLGTISRISHLQRYNDKTQCL